MNEKSTLISFFYALATTPLIYMLWKAGVLDTETVFGVIVPPYIMTVGLVYVLADAMRVGSIFDEIDAETHRDAQRMNEQLLRAWQHRKRIERRNSLPKKAENAHE